MKCLNFKCGFYLLTIVFCSLLFVSCSSSPNNEQIQQSVKDSLQANANTKNVSVAVADGTVTLTGTCDGNNCVAETEDKVKHINGVKSVQNNVTMAPQNTDLTLRTQVQSIVTKYAGVQADVASGVVVLRGSIERSQLQPLMSELNNLQASKIDNQLAVK
ncbi:MAG: BON domain-containing protein [Bacteroidota bacterium]|nr:BON domain-containing protein [Bacteroidota bacterium]